MARLLLILFFTVCLTHTAFASALDDARTLLEDGKFDQAIELARADGSPEGLVLAAETLSTKVMLGYTDDANDSAKQARKWAETAQDKLPRSQEAMVQYALAYGIEARTSSTFRAWRKKLPQKTLAVIDAFRAAYPDDPRGDALLGGWHLGIVQKAGGKNAMKWYSADMSLGLSYYDMALLNSNHDIFIASNFAIALLALDSETYKARVNDLMEHIHQAPAQNALERDIQSRMTTLKNLMGDKEAVKAAAIEMLEG